MRKRLLLALVLILLGSIPLYNATQNPRFEAAHGSDFMQLIGCGMCFGVAWVALIGSIKFPGR